MTVSLLIVLRLKLVRRGLQRLNQVNAKLAGIIITQVDIDKITTYGGDYYYQGYYDYYGYTEAGDKKPGGGKIKLTQEELHQIRSEDDDIKLDLDYMNTGAESNQFQQSSNGSAYDDFDQTAQFDFVPPARRQVAANNQETVKVPRPRKPNARSSRIRGDLDIL